MSNATFSRKPLVAAVLTTLAVFSAGAMAGETEEAKTNVELTIGTAESTTDKTVAGAVQNEQTWDEAWAKEALQKPLFPSRIEQNRSVRFFFTTSKNGVFFAIKIV